MPVGRCTKIVAEPAATSPSRDRDGAKPESASILADRRRASVRSPLKGETRQASLDEAGDRMPIGRKAQRVCGLSPFTDPLMLP